VRARARPCAHARAAAARTAAPPLAAAAAAAASRRCVNCAPLRAGEAVELEMLCTHGRDARCINCLPPDTTVDGRKFLSYDEWLERARDACSHAFGATCVHCAPPVALRYKLRADCAKHRPWPSGICLEW